MNSDGQWKAVRRQLEAMKEAVTAEIHTYPRPIAGCDAQFNHLLEQHRALLEELARLDAIRHDSAQAIEEFLRGSKCLDAAARGAS